MVGIRYLEHTEHIWVEFLYFCVKEFYRNEHNFQEMYWLLVPVQYAFLIAASGQGCETNVGAGAYRTPKGCKEQWTPVNSNANPQKYFYFILFIQKTCRFTLVHITDVPNDSKYFNLELKSAFLQFAAHSLYSGPPHFLSSLYFLVEDWVWGFIWWIYK